MQLVFAKADWSFGGFLGRRQSSEMPDRSSVGDGDRWYRATASYSMKQSDAEHEFYASASSPFPYCHFSLVKSVYANASRVFQTVPYSGLKCSTLK